MKIAYFLDIPQGLGGAGNLLLQRAKLMSELYEVLVIIPCDENRVCNPEYAHRCEKYGLNYKSIFYNTSYNFYDLDIITAYESYKEIEQVVMSEKITFLHSVQLNVGVEMVSRKLNIPHLMDIYQINESEFELCPGDIFAHYHLCDSMLYSKVWEKSLKVISKCVRPIAPLAQVLKKECYPVQKFTILMLGAVSERKNQLAAIKVIEKCILKYDIRLLIAGNKDNFYGKECENYIKDAKLDNYVYMLGFVSDVSELLKESDCLLCTSMDESFPSSMVEAATYDLTIISTPVAGVPEVFKDKYNAFISRDFSSNSIYNSLCECLEAYKDGSINKIHKNLYITWKNNFERNYVQRQIKEYYYEIIKNENFKEPIGTHLYLEVKRMYTSLWSFYNTYTEMRKRCLYHYTLKNKISNKKIYIWGAGMYGDLAYKLLSMMELENINIIAYVDRCKEGFLYDLAVIKPEEMVFDKDSIVFMSFFKNRQKEIHYLEEQGMKLNKEIWIVP